MSSPIDGLGEWFAARTLQEQRILRWGVPLIVFLVVYLLVLQPLLSGWASRQAVLEQRLDDLDWLRAQVPLVERMNSSCDPRQQPLQLDRIENDISALAQRLGLQAQVRRITGEDRWLILLDNAQGNRVLGYARSLVCAGLEVSRLEYSLAEGSIESGAAQLEAGIPTL